MLAALYGTGLRPGDRFFCPSSPAWGHGLWHGTLAPLALGITIGAFSGKFNAERLLRALHDHRVHQSFGGGDALPDDAQLGRRRRTTPIFSTSFPSPASRSTARPRPSPRQTFGHPVCSMYGTTEIGVILVNYPGAADFVGQARLARASRFPAARSRCRTRKEFLARPASPASSRCGAATPGFPTKDLGRVDEDGYFYHGGSRRRRHHLGRLDDERRRDRGRDPEAPAGAGSRRDRRS